jgi:nucleotide-binding universal stress UspA family protein
MLKRILVGLGGTEYTESATNEAIALAMANDAELTGVSIVHREKLRHVGPIPIGSFHLPPEGELRLMEQAMERSEVQRR